MSRGLFLPLAAGAVLSALRVVTGRNPVHAALWLVSTLFFLALLFLSLDAELIAILQVIVYAGAIVVLFLFVIMLLNLQVEPHTASGPPLVAAALAGGLLLAGFLARGLAGATWPAAGQVPGGFGQTETIAERLFTTYLVPFELTSLLLLVAVVGAVSISKRKVDR